MTSAGWYPDPAGTPNTYRYWDGQAWSQQTSTDPFGTGQPAAQQQPPPVVRPQQPQHPQQYAAPPPPSGGGSTGRTIAIAAGGVLALVLLAVLAFVAVNALKGSGDDNTVAASSSSPTATASDSGSASVPAPSALGTINPVTVVCGGGDPEMAGKGKGPTLSAGGLTVPSDEDRGYKPDENAIGAFRFAKKGLVVTKQLEPKWWSTLMVGELPKAAYKGVELAARSVMQCMANSTTMYDHATSLTELSGKAVRIDGHPAYDLTENIKVDDPTVKATGDTVRVVVVDTGDAKNYGMYTMGTPIGDKSLLALQKSTTKQLHVP